MAKDNPLLSLSDGLDLDALFLATMLEVADNPRLTMYEAVGKAQHGKRYVDLKAEHAAWKKKHAQ